MVTNLPANAGDARDAGSIPEQGGSPGVGNGNPLQYSCLENSMDRGVYSPWDLEEKDTIEPLTLTYSLLQYADAIIDFSDLDII